MKLLKKIQNIINSCETKFNKAITQFRSYQIVESKKQLEYLVSFLDNLTKTIQEKNQGASSLLPNVSNLRGKVNKKLIEYNFMTYQLILNIFKNKKLEPKMDLETFSKGFILKCPFISFNDIFEVNNDKNKSTQKVLLETYERSQKSGYKSLLLFGPRGSGKTLAVHALAYQIGGVVAQIEGVSNFKIQYFVKEFARVVTEFTNRPIIVYVRNIETLVQNALPELLFLFDKFNNEKKKLLFICSSSYPMQNLPKQLKFYYIHCVNCANQNSKYNLFKFLLNKFGMRITIPDQELNNFVYQNLRNYSNNDLFQVIKKALDMRKQSGGSLEEIDRSTLENAVRDVPGTLSPQMIKAYYL